LVIDSLSNENIRDIFHAISFLTLFILQKAFNHFIASLHVKPNEILYSSSTADKSVINVKLPILIGEDRNRMHQQFKVQEIHLGMQVIDKQDQFAQETAIANLKISNLETQAKTLK